MCYLLLQFPLFQKLSFKIKLLIGFFSYILTLKPRYNDSETPIW